MRQIKFRAWHKVRKEMYEVHGWHSEYVFKKTDDGVGNPGNPDRLEDVELMQFTGLYDKSGREIYESDIVLANGMESVLNNDMSQARKYISPMISDSRHFEKRRSAYQVYWQHDFCCFSFMSLSTPKHSIEVDVNGRELEIIGDIFTTPELLTKQ
jgi:uncharacterized phage protein (TIGR01671 family)